MFEDMLDNLRETVTSVMCHLELSVDAEELAAMERAQAEIDVQETRMDPAFADKEMALASSAGPHPAAPMQIQSASSKVLSGDIDPADAPPGWELNTALNRWLDPNDPDTWGKVPRNAACPCGSGKKYKHCHGR